MKTTSVQQQKTEWRKKGWSIPDLRGSKHIWYNLVVGLTIELGKNQVTDLDSIPDISDIPQIQPWRVYTPFLKSVGLVINQSGLLRLSSLGEDFINNYSEVYLANLIQDKFRLFGEMLFFISDNPNTVEDIDKKICEMYSLDWANLSNTRRRMDWLEVLGLIHGLGNRKWGITDLGREVLSKWIIVSPDALDLFENEKSEVVIPNPPEDIEALLQQLFDSPELHKKRTTYNIWAPGPNRIQNLKTIVQYASEKVDRASLFQFVQSEFNLKVSSVESMMPFMKADGLIEEVGRNIYMATPAAKAWLESGSDLDFIRILHSKTRFVGEMIVAVKDKTVRNDMYAQAKQYGLNTEKARWIAGFLVEAGLLEEPQYLHIKATPMGIKFAETLPLAEMQRAEDIEEKKQDKKECGKPHNESELDKILKRFEKSSTDPMAEGKASGVAFEEAISDVFSYMGFQSKRIGGAGDTDVVVQWKDNKGELVTAVVDGKSKSSGSVVHSDISDVAIETHKEKNNAKYVAIVGSKFSGNTIINHAKKKRFALLTVPELSEIARASRNYGLDLQEIALLFQVPNGLSAIEELISQKHRELELITIVISHFKTEQDALGSLCPRDLFFSLKNTDQSPSLEELINAFDNLSKSEVGVIEPVSNNPSPEYRTYVLKNEKSSAYRLRALADAIESGFAE